MKRLFVFLSALALVVGCNKDAAFSTRPSITGEDGALSQIEYAPGQAQNIVLTAANGMDMLTVSLPSGNPDFIIAGAKKIIGTAANRTGGTMVMDAIDDNTVAKAFLSGKVTTKAGASLRGSKESLKLNVTNLVTLLIAGQDISTVNTIVRLQVDVMDQAEYRTTQTVSVRITPGPTVVWVNNEKSEAITLEQAANYKNVKVEAPGKIKGITLKLTSSSTDFTKWVKERGATDASGNIDLLSADSALLKVVASTVAGSEGCTLDFTEMFANLKLYAKAGGSHTFVITVTDQLGRTGSLAMKITE